MVNTKDIKNHKNSVFGEKRKNVDLGTFRKNRKVDAESVPKSKCEGQTETNSLSDVIKEKSESFSEKSEPKYESLYELLDDAEKKWVKNEVDKTVKWSLRLKFTGECLFPVLLVCMFVFWTSRLSDSNEVELESRRTQVAEAEITANVKVLKSIEAKNPKEPLPDTLELVAATEFGKNNVVVVDPWGKPYVYDKKNRLLRCIVKNPDGSVKYEIARRF